MKLTTASVLSPFRVVIAGGGPVGLTAANLLATAGVEVILVERNATTSDEAKAISMDAESLRVLDGLGLGDRLNAVMVPGTGVRFHNRHGKRVFQARGRKPYIYGYAVKSQFSQPELERLLLDQLQLHERAQLRFDTELIGYRNVADGVDIDIRRVGTDTVETLRADYLLGCDGGRSTVRKLAGIPMTGRSFSDVWLVVDTIGDQHDDRCSMHFGVPDRPYVIVPGGNGRCRYEFLLRPGEGTARERPPFELIERLLAPHRAITADQVERSVNYTFSGLVADRWRDRRVFLLGDAAHMMPPFAGQGLNSGIRDAANLCWKLSLVAHGRAAATLLDSYEAERKPHTEATVTASVRQGRIVMTSNRLAAVVRDTVVAVMLRIPRWRDYLVHLNYLPEPRLPVGVVVRDGPETEELVGRPLDQPNVLHPDGSTSRLDEVLGTGFTLLGVDVTAADWALTNAAFDDLPAQRLSIVLGDRRPRWDATPRAVGDADGELEDLLSGVSGRFVLLRPDRYVAAVFRSARAEFTASALRRLLGSDTVLPIPTAKGAR
ncbi:bifunctional 3-(3-hydroxy-phenyl)propionate/3-hydroxycinnamic acid hydroxylase [Nocardia exalbida]|uniref:bifunctional 3-(3-hydroxy-phenyl)propionate/3-hydroxycinnamic acid hydroxylase n=1 Tax=Nocardia exalbida TaxID=290231 RepID=UPI00030E1253|nr:bifunctional 3-(3-hydroxy-phenyl)propionate/3-hydroxycinnamic acid hydroxylase [Nocardia exalbida]